MSSKQAKEVSTANRQPPLLSRSTQTQPSCIDSAAIDTPRDACNTDPGSQAGLSRLTTIECFECFVMADLDLRAEQRQLSVLAYNRNGPSVVPASQDDL